MSFIAAVFLQPASHNLGNKGKVNLGGEKNNIFFFTAAPPFLCVVISSYNTELDLTHARVHAGKCTVELRYMCSVSWSPAKYVLQRQFIQHVRLKNCTMDWFFFF